MSGRKLDRQCRNKTDHPQGTCGVHRRCTRAGCARRAAGYGAPDLCIDHQPKPDPKTGDCGDDECVARGGGRWCAKHGGPAPGDPPDRPRVTPRHDNGRASFPLDVNGGGP